MIKHNYPNSKITLLGFSQGVATMMRWIHKSSLVKFNRLILWAGGLPMDVMDQTMIDKITTKKPVFIYGNSDQFIKKESVDEIFNTFKNKGLSFDVQYFEGGHNVYEEPLLKLF